MFIYFVTRCVLRLTLCIVGTKVFAETDLGLMCQKYFAGYRFNTCMCQHLCQLLTGTNFSFLQIVVIVCIVQYVPS